MQKTTRHVRTVFSAAMVRKGLEAFDELSGDGYTTDYSLLLVHPSRNEEWNLDSLDEWMARYAERPVYATFNAQRSKPHNTMAGETYPQWRLSFGLDGVNTRISVDGTERASIDRVHNTFNEMAETARVEAAVPPPTPVRIFIGHGRASDWRDLKDHLADLHGYEVQAFESGARAGHAIRDVIDSLATSSDFALLVMTAEDETSEGDFRARQNVVHETGLFQGHLGWHRAIVVVENGVEDFSNIDGIVQLRFTKGKIKETFGDVLATLRREFGPPPA